MYTIEWTQTALTDLEIILAYYAQKVSPELAKKIFLKIQSQVKVLGQFPKSARMGRVKDTKEYIISGLPYIAVLYIVQGKVIILNLIHTKKKYPL